MRILFVADGRSPIALNWMAYFLEAGDEVHLVSLYPCQTDLPFASVHWLRVPFLGSDIAARPHQAGLLRRFIPTPWRTKLRQYFVPYRIRHPAQELRLLIDRLKPDLVHAMRIPYEGMVAALSNPDCPLLISVWGNDLTLHVSANRRIRQLTRQALCRANALHTDCYRDQRLAGSWGFSPSLPSCVLPGAGGVQRSLFYPQLNLVDPKLVVNPRGLRAYVRNDTFFRAVALVHQEMPDVRFVCSAMKGEAEAERWILGEKITAAVELLPRLSRQEMADLFRRAAVTVSITEHDGTPNTLLEAMACGSFPIAGDLESLREWITCGANGDLVAPDDPEGLASAILRALADESLRLNACQINQQIIDQRADYAQVMPEARRFYQSLLG